MGAFTCCRKGHVVKTWSGDLIEIPCDKGKVGAVLVQLCEARLASLRAHHQRLMHNLFYCIKMTMFAGSEHKGTDLGDASESTDQFLGRILYSDLDDLDEMGDTCLHWAMFLAHPTLIHEILLARPNLLTTASKIGFTPLLASLHRTDKHFTALLDRFDGSALNAGTYQVNQCPLDRAAKYGFSDRLALLLAKRADAEIKRKDNGFTPLLSATEAGYADCCRILLDYRADVNARGLHGDTCLHLAAVPLTLIGNNSAGAKLAVMRELLYCQADPASLNNSSQTALEVADAESFDACGELLRGFDLARVASGQALETL